MMSGKADYEKLMMWVAKFHSLFSTAWPKPGEPALAGASVFIGTTLWKSLENAFPLFQEAIEASNECDSKLEIEQFLGAFKLLFSAVGNRDRNEKSEQVDFALNLLYFASGIFYQRLEALSFTRPDLKKEFISIRPFDELLNVCRWPQKTESVKSVFDSLISQMTACAQDLK
jgi:hypothetical protein